MGLWTRYGFWLLAISGVVFALERAFAWRKDQPVLRPQLVQDLLWFTFNGFFAYGALAVVMDPLEGALAQGFKSLTGELLTGPGRLQWLTGLPVLAQALTVLVVGDLFEWSIHNLLHRVPWLWRFHRVHHSIKHMDFIGNFRFHYVEIIVYRALKFVPMALIFSLVGAQTHAILGAAVFGTLVGHLNHANLNWCYGPFRYVFNSPQMHLWHHDQFPSNGIGYNFGIVFSVWDWVFGTAKMPPRHAFVPPAEIGFADEGRTYTGFLGRFVLPFWNR